MTIDDREKMKLVLAGFRLIAREMSLCCIREWHPQDGWRPIARCRSAKGLNREFDRFRREPRTIAVLSG